MRPTAPTYRFLILPASSRWSPAPQRHRLRQHRLWGRGRGCHAGRASSGQGHGSRWTGSMIAFPGHGCGSSSSICRPLASVEAAGNELIGEGRPSTSSSTTRVFWPRRNAPHQHSLPGLVTGLRNSAPAAAHDTRSACRPGRDRARPSGRAQCRGSGRRKVTFRPCKPPQAAS